MKKKYIIEVDESEIIEYWHELAVKEIGYQEYCLKSCPNIKVKPYEERLQGDLISREALKKALKSNCDTLCNDKNTNWCEHCCPLNDFEDLIDNAPTVEERPHGEWIDLSTDGRHTGWIACSVCGQEPPNESNFHSDFCPNCGADMRGGAE